MSELSKPDLANPLSRTLSVVLAQYQGDQTPPTTKVHTAGRVLASPTRGPISNDQPETAPTSSGWVATCAIPQARMRSAETSTPNALSSIRKGWLIACEP